MEIMSTATWLLSSLEEEEVLIESATKKEYWVDDLVNHAQQLSPLLDVVENNDDDVAAGSSPPPAAAAAENNGFLDAHLFDLQQEPPPQLDPDDVMNGDHDQPFSTNVDVDMDAASVIINDFAARSSDQAAPLPSAAENNGFLVSDHHPLQYYQDDDHPELSWRGSSMLGGTSAELGGFGHQQQQQQGQLGAIPPISGLNYSILQPSYTQYSGGASSMLNIINQGHNFLQFRDNNVSDHPLNKLQEICEEDMDIAAAAITCRRDYDQEYQNSHLVLENAAPWPAHQPQWDQIITFPNTMEPIRIPTPSSSSTNGVGEDQKQKKKKTIERWTEEEHKNMLRGIMKYGKGDWKNISREFVKTKSAVQVASHAQKLDARLKENQEMQAAGTKRKRRSSIHDITIDHVDPSVSSNN